MIGEATMHPDWVTQHKKKGTNISCIGGRYYLYAVTSVWNKEKGRAQMVNKGYLGRITEDGFIPKKDKIPRPTSPVTVKEFGATNTVWELSADIRERLIESFGRDGEMVYAIALLRFLRTCPFKRVELSYRHSFLSELLPSLRLGGKEISEFMRRFGENREQLVSFMSKYVGEVGHILFDGTGITSNSDKMSTSRVGYSAKKKFDPKINLMYAFSLEAAMPVYYRVFPGNIPDMSAFQLCLQESGIKNMVVVADKGFSSDFNFELLDSGGLKYIIPLKRNSSLYDPSILKKGDKSAFEGYFMHEKRPIWYYTSKNGVVVFLNPDLKAEEERTYICNIEAEKEGYTMSSFLEKQHTFGTIVMKTNLQTSPSDIYAYYKQRREIEQSFDFLKNLLEQDKSYMQNEKSLETWAFINHISMLLCYKVYNILREKKLIEKYSLADFLEHLKYISKVRINGDFVTSEITKPTKALLTAVGVHIT